MLLFVVAVVWCGVVWGGVGCCIVFCCVVLCCVVSCVVRLCFVVSCFVLLCCVSLFLSLSPFFFGVAFHFERVARDRKSAHCQSMCSGAACLLAYMPAFACSWKLVGVHSLLWLARTAWNTTPHHTTQHDTTQHNTTQHNIAQHNTHNTAQHNTTQREISLFLCCHGGKRGGGIFRLCVGPVLTQRRRRRGNTFHLRVGRLC